MAGAWVQLESPAGQVALTTHSNDEGEFMFVRIDTGRYALRSGGPAGGAAFVSDVDVPSPTGRYDLSLS